VERDQHLSPWLHYYNFTLAWRLVGEQFCLQGFVFCLPVDQPYKKRILADAAPIREI